MTDKHIKCAQKLVGNKYKNVYSLKLTLTLYRVPVRCTKNFLQIMHCRTNHWIVASTILSHPKVTVYDFLFDSVDANTIGILKQLFGPKVEVIVNNDRKQVGAEDCGLFATASCICLAEKCLPENYDQSKMRQHLVKCTEDLNFTVFPCVLNVIIVMCKFFQLIHCVIL